MKIRYDFHLMIPAALLAGFALPALAQTPVPASTPAIAPAAAGPEDTVRLRRLTAGSTLDPEFVRITQELETQRRVMMDLRRVYEELAVRVQSANGQSERAANEQAARAMFEKVLAARDSEIDLRHRLEVLCSADEKPAGYFGLALTGTSTLSRMGDGQFAVSYQAHQTVESVEPGSPAEKAGIRARDVIIAIGGRDLRAGDVIAKDLLVPGLRVPVTLLRAGDRKTMLVTIAPRPEGFDMEPCPFIDASIASAIAPLPNAMTFKFVMPDSSAQGRVFLLRRPQAAATPSGAEALAAPTQAVVVAAGPYAAGFTGGMSVVAGLQLMPMNHDLGETFGVDEGLLVLNVLPGTMALTAGLHGGDVLLTADDQSLTSARVLERVIRNSTDHEVKLVLVRKHSKETVTLRW